MNNNYRVSFLILSICIYCSSCGLFKKTPTNWDNALIELRTTPCYGECPVFKISIQGNGQALLENVSNMPQLGSFTKTLPVDSIQALFLAFHKAKFFKFEDKYTSNITDFPTTYVKYTFGDKSKEIMDYYGAPEALNSLEDKVIRIVYAKDWIVVKESIPIR